MNRSKLYEWLLDNDCPWEWDPVTETYYEDSKRNSVTIVFADEIIDEREETQ